MLVIQLHIARDPDAKTLVHAGIGGLLFWIWDLKPMLVIRLHIARDPDAKTLVVHMLACVLDQIGMWACFRLDEHGLWLRASSTNCLHYSAGLTKLKV